MNLKRTITALCLATLLGIGCGFVGVWVGESRVDYPEPDIGFASWDVLEEITMDASLAETKALILRDLAAPRE